MTKILLVEDDKSLREIYGVRLLAEGYDIISAGDGEEALAMAIKERPALIVSDVMMPKISGFDMLDILRSTTETKDIKVIMMTALSSEDQRQRGVALGADRYLVKSQVGIEDVVRTVHEVLADAPVTSTSFTPPAQSSPAPAAPAPVTPTPVTPAPAPQPVAPANPLPQPTAPFTTPRPSNLGDRVIHPPEHNDEPKDIGLMIDQELAGQTTPRVAPETPTPVSPSLDEAPTPIPTEPEVASAPAAPALVTPTPVTPAPDPIPAPTAPAPQPAPAPVPTPPAPAAPSVPQNPPAAPGA